LGEALLAEDVPLLDRRILRVDDDVRLEVENPLEVAQADVEQVADAAREALEEPDVAHRRGELDVAHALTAHLGLGHLDAALVADDAAMLHPLELPAEALPVRHRTEDLRAEQTVPLRFEGPVVDRLRLGDLAVRPRPDLLGRGEADPDAREVVDRPGPVEEE